MPTRILKQPQSPLNASAAQRLLSDRQPTPAGDERFAREHALIDEAKKLAIASLGFAADAYGDGLKEEQEVLAHIADIMIEVYAVESALARSEKLATRQAGRAATATDIARVYASDAADRMAHASKQVLAALHAHGAPASGLSEAVTRLAARPSVDTISARRRIAAEVIEAGRYPY